MVDLFGGFRRGLANIGLFVLLIGASAIGRGEALPAVVINEILYHPAAEDDSTQFIELHNRTGSPVDIGGWSFTHGIKFTFSEKTVIPAKGFLVVCHDKKAFQKAFGSGLPTVGNFPGKLKHGGGKIELVDAAQRVVESFKYEDHAPWPAGADDGLASLERICPDAPADQPQNWAASKSISVRRGQGTPGRVNDNHAKTPLPFVSEVKWTRANPGEAIKVTATIADAAGVGSAAILYRLAKPGRESEEAEAALSRVSGDAKQGFYEGTIPAQPANTLVRFRIKASGQGGGTRFEPSETEPRRAYSWYVFNAPERAKIPIAHVVNVTRPAHGGQKFGDPIQEASGPGNSAFVYVPPEGPIQVFDFVQARPRAGGWKVHFLKDQLLNGMSGINLIFESSPRWVLAEALAYELYRRAGVLTEQAGHYRLTVDGRPQGYHLMVEQPNKTFLARNQRSDKGNLYKILWYQQGIENQYEKKTNPLNGHGDIKSLIENLARKSGADQWNFIQEQFNVEEMAGYYAVNMCIQNWDGFFNNYFVYHDLRPGGKWEIIPWDEDKTWGDFDGAPSDYSWYDMPLTMGMNGDRPPRAVGFSRGLYGGPGWWRPGGSLAGPLLANQEFRKRVMTRLQELCATVFTEEKFLPVINSMEQKLKPEVAARAGIHQENPRNAEREFEADMESMRRQVANRRKYILNHLK